MAKNTGRGSRAAAAEQERSGRHDAETGIWTRRNPSSGLFLQAKRSGGRFKGVRREG